MLDSGAIPLLVHLAMQPSTDAEVRSEACWVVLNATSCGSDSQVTHTTTSLYIEFRDIFVHFEVNNVDF